MLPGPSPSIKPVTAVLAAPGVGAEAMKPDTWCTPLIPAAGRQREAGGSQSLRPAWSTELELQECLHRDNLSG